MEYTLPVWDDEGRSDQKEERREEGAREEVKVPFLESPCSCRGRLADVVPFWTTTDVAGGLRRILQEINPIFSVCAD
jgi:hypothetical protein